MDSIGSTSDLAHAPSPEPEAHHNDVRNAVNPVANGVQTPPGSHDDVTTPPLSHDDVRTPPLNGHHDVTTFPLPSRDDVIFHAHSDSPRHKTSNREIDDGSNSSNNNNKTNNNTKDKRPHADSIEKPRSKHKFTDVDVIAKDDEGDDVTMSSYEYITARNLKSAASLGGVCGVTVVSETNDSRHGNELQDDHDVMCDDFEVIASRQRLSSIEPGTKRPNISV
jgi:hypothetical protein